MGNDKSIRNAQTILWQADIKHATVQYSIGTCGFKHRRIESANKLYLSFPATSAISCRTASVCAVKDLILAWSEAIFLAQGEGAEEEGRTDGQVGEDGACGAGIEQSASAAGLVDGRLAEEMGMEVERAIFGVGFVEQEEGGIEESVGGSAMGKTCIEVLGCACREFHNVQAVQARTMRIV